MKKNRMKSLNPGIQQRQSTKSIDELLAEASIEEEKQPYKVPENWFWTRLGSVTEINMGQSPIGEYTTNKSKYTPLIGGPSDMGDLYPNISRYTTAPARVSKEGDIIISVRATLGRTNISNGIYCLGRGVAGITPIKIKPFFLIYYLKYNNRLLYEVSSGTTFPQISKDNLSNIPLPLPSSEEQYRIIKKLDSMLGKIAEARELIQEARDSFEVRRNAILHKAFTGELTEKWREENKDTEPAEALLNKIILKNSALKREEKETEIQIFPYPFALPKNWKWCRINDLVNFVGSGVTPKGGRKIYIKKGVPFIRSQNVLSGKLYLEDIVYISQDIHNSMKRTILFGGETLLNITGASIGRSAYVPADFGEANVNQHV